MKKPIEGDVVPKLLGVVADLIGGERHSRRTVAKATGRSLATADRWIEHIALILPNIRRVKEGRTTWLVHDGRRNTPTKLAVVGACVAASLASMFEGTQHERNLKDARDYLLRERGDAYGDLDRKFVFAPRGGEYSLPDAAASLDEVIDAVLKTRRLSFSYQHNSGRAEQLIVEPLSLVIFDHQFYVLSRRSDRSLYCYRFARMGEVDVTTEAFEYPSKNEYNPRNVLDPGFGIHISGAGPVEDVAVVLTGAWANFAQKHRWHPTQQVIPGENGSVVVTFRVRLCPELEAWVLGFGDSALVSRPLKLREAVSARLARASAGYAVGSTMGPAVAKAKRGGLARRAARTRPR